MKEKISRKKVLEIISGIFILIAILLFSFSLPKPLFKSSYSPVLYDRNGRMLGAVVSSDGQWRFYSESINESKFARAIIEYEDKRFLYHFGIDPAAIGRAFIQNLKAKKVVSGGSTITMQTIRLMRGNKNRTFPEKVIEAILAVRLEFTHSKNDILSLYAANAPFGGNVVGFEAASWRWFGRSSRELSWAEAATLAVLPNSPALVHPGRNRDILKAKRDTLLEKLNKKGFITNETLFLSKTEPLPSTPKPLPQLAPHLLVRAINDNNIKNPKTGETINSFITTIDFRIQERADIILNRWAEKFEGNDILNSACLILDTATGEVLAYIGNVNSKIAKNVDIIKSPRSSGSILKPFLYAAMLDSGEIMPTGIISDIPTRIGSYNPQNNTKEYIGMVPANQALARSLNVPAVRSLQSYGVERFARLLRNLGITTLFRHGEDYGLPLILGGAEVTLWDMAGLYSGLARTAIYPDSLNSQFFPPFYNYKNSRQSRNKKVISSGAAWLTLDALTNVVRPGEEAAWQNFASSRKIAWKTGTSFGFRDAWAIGVTTKWTIAVWVGNATGEGRAELRSTTTAAPVMFELFSFLDTAEWFKKPFTNLKLTEVCFYSGYPASVSCDKTRFTEIPAEAPHHNSCIFCKTVVLNEAMNKQISLSATPGEKTVQKNWFILPPAEEWYYKRWNLDYKILPPFDGVSHISSPIALFSPENKTEIYVPIELDGTPGKVVFSAAHRESKATLFWHLDNNYLGSTNLFHEIETRPQPGPHILVLVDDKGNTIQRSFTILNNLD